MRCAECERSNGPHYRGRCEHRATTLTARALTWLQARIDREEWVDPTGRVWVFVALRGTRVVLRDEDGHEREAGAVAMWRRWSDAT